MTQLPNSDANGEAHIENETIDEEKQPLNNGIARANETLIIENADRTDDACVQSAEHQKISKRKYKTYDNGKRSRVNLTPIKARGIRIENTLKQKTGLTRAGLILAVLCLLLTIALIVCIIILLSETTLTKIPVCGKPSCLKSSSQILPKLNLDECPCSDFRNYSCGNWIMSYTLPKNLREWNMKELLLHKYRKRVHELLTSKRILMANNATMWKLKYLYDTCMDNESSSFLIEHVKEIIFSLGGRKMWWKEFDDSPPWKLQQVFNKLQLEYNIWPLFQIDVDLDPLNTTQNAIFIKPPILTLPSLNYYLAKEEYPVIVNAFKRYLSDVFVTLDMTSLTAYQLSEDLFNFEANLAEMMTLHKENTSQPQYTRMYLRELHRNLPSIDYKSIVKLFGNLETVVMVENYEYFKELYSVFSIRYSPSVYKYIVWHIISQYIPYLSDGYLQMLEFFKKRISDDYEPLPRWEFCISTLLKYTGFGLMALFESEVTFEEREKIQSTISQIFSETSSIVKKNFEKVKHFKMQQKNRDKLKNIGIQIGLPPYMLNEPYIKDYYDKFEVSGSFAENIGCAFRFGKEILQKKMKQNRGESLLNDMISMPVSISYNAAANYIVVPWSILQEPYFEAEYPLTSLYGGIGTEMSKTLVRNLIQDDNEEEKNKYVSAISECVLGKDFTNLTIPDKTEFIVTLAGLKFSYECLIDESSFVEYTLQPAMESFKTEELFFINYVQSICTVKTDGRTRNGILSRTSSDHVLSNKVLSELSEFSELYSCKWTSNYVSSLCVG